MTWIGYRAQARSIRRLSKGCAGEDEQLGADQAKLRWVKIWAKRIALGDRSERVDNRQCLVRGPSRAEGAVALRSTRLISQSPRISPGRVGRRGLFRLRESPPYGLVLLPGHSGVTCMLHASCFTSISYTPLIHSPQFITSLKYCHHATIKISPRVPFRDSSIASQIFIHYNLDRPPRPSILESY